MAILLYIHLYFFACVGNYGKIKKIILNIILFGVGEFRYHFDGSTRKFFEGWYFKVSIPEQRQSFCFMYSIENPSFQKKLNKLEEAQYGPRSMGVGAQILGADDKYICQYTEESQRFWGSKFQI